MLFSSRLSPSTLLIWCRALRHGLHAGLSPVRVFRHQAKSGPTSARPLADEIAGRLEKGDSLEDALGQDRHRFPLLFVELIAVGEQTGRLVEAFETLESYFDSLLATRRQFVRALIWPGIMYVGAVMTVTLLLFIMGMIPGGFDPIGLGLTGPAGATTFLIGVASVTTVTVIAFLKIRDDDTARGLIESKLLPVPALGGCFRAFALQRFSLAMHMTTEAGLRADRGLKLSLRATANNAYLAHADRAAKDVRGGEEVAEVLKECGQNLFPADYLEAVQLAEVSGQLAEVMARLAKQYQEEAARKMTTLTMIAGGAVYAMVGLMVVVVILRILMAIGGIYQDAMQGL